MADNSLRKSNFIARYGPGRAGIGVRLSDNRIWTDIDGTRRPLNLDNVVALTTTRTVTAKESGTTFMLNHATSFTTTLPAPAVGLSFKFYVQIVGTATGHKILPGAGVTITLKASASGAAIPGVAGTGVINTAGTGIIGDSVELFCDGSNWFGTTSGVWAASA